MTFPFVLLSLIFCFGTGVVIGQLLDIAEYLKNILYEIEQHRLPLEDE